MTASDLEKSLGEQLRAERLRKNLTMADLALKAGVSDQTVRALEAGKGGRVESLLRVVLALGRADWLVSFRPPVRISPLQIAQGKSKRQRGSRSVLAVAAKKDQRAVAFQPFEIERSVISDQPQTSRADASSGSSNTSSPNPSRSPVGRQPRRR